MKQKLLSATGDELSALLGEVLLGEHELTKYTLMCKKCGHWKDKHEVDGGGCTIAITPANAKKHKGISIDIYGYDAWKKALGYVHTYFYFDHRDLDEQFFDYIEWLEIAITEAEILQASALCKLNAEKGK